MVDLVVVVRGKVPEPEEVDVAGLRRLLSQSLGLAPEVIDAGLAGWLALLAAWQAWRRAEEAAASLAVQGLCNGTLSGSEYVYAVHGVGVECPYLHRRPSGELYEPGPDGRLRAFLGRPSSVSHELVAEAIERYVAWQRRRREAEQARQSVQRLLADFERLKRP